MGFKVAKTMQNLKVTIKLSLLEREGPCMHLRRISTHLTALLLGRFWEWHRLELKHRGYSPGIPGRLHAL